MTIKRDITAYRKTLSAKRIAENRCVYCGHENDRVPKQSCTPCTIYRHNRRQTFRGAGKCSCGRDRYEKFTRCLSCYNAATRYRLAKQARKAQNVNQVHPQA